MSTPRSQTLIQSYVRDRYFVSTMYRRSSAMLAPDSSYYETLAWEWDCVTRERGAMVRLASDGTYGPGSALTEHLRICALLAGRCEPCTP